MPSFLKKRDLIFIFALLAFGIIGLILYTGLKGNGDYVLVSVDGEVYGTYDLNVDTTVSIPYEGKTGNVLVISDGQVYMKDASCPDRLCVKQGRIDGNGKSIVCLPHKVVVTVETQKEGSYDAIAQ